MKEDSEKVGLKLNIKKTKHDIRSHNFMANRWGYNGNSDRLFSWAPTSLQVMKRRLLLGRKVMTNLDIKKQRYYFADKGPSSQSYGFTVAMYECERWTIKKAEHQRIDVFDL